MVRSANIIYLSSLEFNCKKFKRKLKCCLIFDFCLNLLVIPYYFQWSQCYNQKSARCMSLGKTL